MRYLVLAAVVVLAGCGPSVEQQYQAALAQSQLLRERMATIEAECRADIALADDLENSLEAVRHGEALTADEQATRTKIERIRVMARTRWDEEAGPLKKEIATLDGRIMGLRQQLDQ